MRSGLIILIASAGTVAALLIPASRQLARHAWPGPTVKGPGDVYAQAFRVIIVLVGLIVLAVISALIAWITASVIDWRVGQWLSAAPLVGLLLSAGVIAVMPRR